jgi:hypothetical protein
MKILLTVFLVFFLVSNGKAQSFYRDFSDSVIAKFDYAGMGNYGCNQFPTGVYSIVFRVDSTKAITSYYFTPDTLPVLQKFLWYAVSKAATSLGKQLPANDYLLLVYFNDVLDCKDTDTIIPSNIHVYVRKILEQQIKAFQQGLVYNVIPGNYFVLPPVVLDGSKKRMTYYLDLPQTPTPEVPPERLKKMEEQLLELKRMKETKH